MKHSGIRKRINACAPGRGGRRAVRTAAMLLAAALTLSALTGCGQGFGALLPTDTPRPTDTPEPTPTPEPAPTPTPEPAPMTVSETLAVSADTMERVGKCANAAEDYYYAYWQTGSMTVNREIILQEEEKWVVFRDDLAALESELGDMLPEPRLRESWVILSTIVRHYKEIAGYLADWDRNGDGIYSNEEMHFANQNAYDLFMTALSEMIWYMGWLDELLELDAAERQRAEHDPSMPLPTPPVTPTPSPTPTPTPTPRPTPKPTRRPTVTAKPKAKSDPYHAKDFDDPEDFYDEYYDDFWDYEDAEDYWLDHY